MFPTGWAPGGHSTTWRLLLLWASERSGSGASSTCITTFRQRISAKSCREESLLVAEGEFVVEEVAAVDDAKELVYFTGNKDVAIEKHLYCASFSSESRLLPL